MSLTGEWKGKVLTHLADRLEEKAKQRSEDMRDVQEEAGFSQTEQAEPAEYILYTYQTGPSGALVCHTYGPAGSTAAQQAGVTLQNKAAQAEQPELNFMVLPLEALPSWQN